MENRHNDWIATLINTKDRSDVSFNSLYANGITPDNIILHEEDYYKSIPQVKEEFTENGKFNEEKFDEFYKNAVATYNYYSNEEYQKTFMDSVPVSPYSVKRLEDPSRQVQNISPIVLDYADRNRRTFGTENIWQIGNPNFSDAEVAQANKLRDENGKILDYTPNDMGFFKSLWSKPAALASYDKDGYYLNEFTGEEEWHNKGELMVDYKGDPYYQYLGNKDSYGKQMLHPTDILTTEGTVWNKFDFFDSDGLDSDPAKVIVRSAVKIAPYLIPGVNAVWGTLGALMGIGAAFPTLAKSLDSFITGTDNDKFGRSMTVLENWVGKFGKSQPQNVQGKFFSFENIADLVTSSVNQFATQRAVGVQAVKWLGLKPAQATQVALGYMALTSTTDAYGEAKQAGANDQVAGLVALGSAAAMWGLMQAGYFKDNLTRGTILDEDVYLRKNIKELAIKEAQETMGENLNKVSFKPGWWADNLAKEKGIGKFLAKCRAGGIELYRTINQKVYGSAAEGYFSRAMNEGIEEVMEEASSDFLKGLTLGMQKLGLNISEDPDTQVDYGFSPQDFIQRYGAAFVGGAIGGAVFEGVNNIGYLQDPNLRRLAKSDAMTRIYADLLNDPDNVKFEKYKKAIDNLKIGDKNLSILKSFRNETPEGEEQIFYQGTEGDNQRQYMRNVMRNLINTVHDIIETEGLSMFSNPEVVQMILTSEDVKKKAEADGKNIYDYLEDESEQGAINRVDALVTALQDNRLLDRAVIDAKNIGLEIIKTSIDLQGIKDEAIKKNNFKNNEEIDKYLKNHSKYQRLTKKLNNLRAEYKSAMYGSRAADYFGHALMMIKGSPRRYFYDLFNTDSDYKEFVDIESYAKVMHNVDYNSLTEEQKDELNEEYKAFVDKDAELTWNIYQFYKKASLDYKENLESINEKLKDSKADPFTTETHASEIKRIKQTRDKIAEKLKELEANGEQESDEYHRMQSLLVQETFKLATAEAMSPGSILGVAFDTKRIQEAVGHQDLNTNLLDSNDAIESYKETVLDYYQYLIDNKIIPVDRLALIHNLFMSLGSNLNTTKDITVEKEDGTTSTFNSKTGNINTHIANVPKKIFRQFLLDNGLTEEANIYITEEEVNADPYGEISDVLLKASELVQNHPEIFGDLVPEELPSFIYSKYGPKFLQDNLVERIERIQNLMTTDFLKGAEEMEKFISDIEASGDPREWLPFFNFDDYFAAPNNTNAIGIASWLLFNDFPLINFIRQVVPMIKNLEQSPLEDLLQKLSVTFNGETNNIIALINSQWDLLNNVENQSDFEITKEAKEALEKAINIINLACALIEGASGGYNEAFNSKSSTKLAIMGGNAASILAKELDVLKQRASYLLELSGVNLSQRFEEEQNFFRFDTRARIKYFVEPPEDKKKIVEGVTKVFKEEFGEDFSFAKLGGINAWDFEDTDEKVESFDKQRVLFQRSLYELFSRVSDKPGFISKIIDAFLNADPSIANANAGVLGGTNEPTSYGMLRWLLSNLTTSQYDVSEKLLSICKEEGILMPTYGQELVIMDSYSFLNNPYLYNTLLDKMKDSLIKQYKVDGKEDPFFKEMPVLKNLHFINGVPGAGKTEVIAFIVKRLLEISAGADAVEFVVASATQKQAEKLQQSLSRKGVTIPQSRVLAWESSENGRGTLGSYIVSADDTEEFNNAKDHLVSTKSSTPEKSLKDLVPGTEKTKLKVLIFDELPLLNEVELSKLTERAAEAGFVIIGLGDLNQVTPVTMVRTVKNGEETDAAFEVGMSNTVFNSSFRLTASFRETNKGQSENNKTVYNTINLVQEQLFKDRSYGRDAADGDIETTLENKTLIHYETPNAYYGFDYFDSGNIDSIITKLKGFVNGKEHSIAIIVDSEEDKEKYSKYQGDASIDIKTKNEVVDLKNKKEAQGGEYEYILADIILSPSSYIAAKEFYTTMSRAKNAAFFKAGSLNRFKIKTTSNPDASSILRRDGDPKQQEAYDNYKKWRLSLLEAVPKESINPTGKTDDGSKGGEEVPPAAEAPDKAVVDQGELQELVDASQKDWLDEVLKGGKSKVNSRDVASFMARKSSISTKENPLKPSKLTDLHNKQEGYIDLDYFLSEFSNIYNKYKDSSYCKIAGIWTNENDNLDTIGKISSLIWNFASKKDVTGPMSTKIQDLIRSLDKDSGTLGNYLFYVDGDSVISLTYLDANNKVKIIPIGIVPGIKTGLYTKIPKVSLVAETMLVSSKGENWVKLSDVARGKMQVNGNDAIFLGLPDSSEWRPVEGQEEFNNTRKGRTFGVLTEFYDPTDINFLLEPERDSQDGKSGFITYFQRRGENHRAIARFAGKAIRVTPEDYIQISKYTRDLLFRSSDVSSRNKTISEIRSILKKFDKADVNLLFEHIKSKKQKDIDGVEESDNHIKTAKPYHFLPEQARKIILGQAIKLALDERNANNNSWCYRVSALNDPHSKWEYRYRGITLSYYDSNNDLHQIHVRTSEDSRGSLKVEKYNFDDNKWETWRVVDVSTKNGILKDTFASIFDVPVETIESGTIDLSYEGKYKFTKPNGEVELKYVQWAEDAEGFVDSLSADKKKILQDWLEEQDIFKHGIYLNNIPTEYIESEGGNIWSFNEHEDEETDITYIMAPLYRNSDILDWIPGDIPTGYSGIVENAESFGIYTSEETKEGVLYKFKSLKLSGETLSNKTGIATKSGAFYDIDSIEVKHDFVKGKVAKINFSDSTSSKEIEGTAVENLLDYVLSKSINEENISLEDADGFSYKVTADGNFENVTNGFTYKLYEIRGERYLVSNDDTVVRKLRINKASLQFEAEKSDMLLYIDGKWRNIKEGVNGTLYISGDEKSSFHPNTGGIKLEDLSEVSDKIFGYNEYIPYANISFIEKDLEDRFSQLMKQFSDFPKKDKKTLAAWINSINEWLKKPENLCKFAKSYSGDLIKSISIAVDDGGENPKKSVKYTLVDSWIYKGAAWYAEEYMSGNMQNIKEVGMDETGNILITLDKNTVKVIRTKDGFFLYNEDYEALQIPKNLLNILLPKVNALFNNPNDSNLLVDLMGTVNSLSKDTLSKEDKAALLQRIATQLDKLVKKTPC